VQAREVRDFVRAAVALQRETRCTFEAAKTLASVMLGDGTTPAEIPTPQEFSAALVTVRRRNRGRPRSETLPKSEAVAAVASYFESIGAAREQAIDEAKRWLSVSLSRRVAKSAVAAFKNNTSVDQYKLQALWAYATFNPGTTLPLPDGMVKLKKRRITKRELG